MFRKKIKFQAADCREGVERLDNPGRGWYRIFPVRLRADGALGVEELRSFLGGEEALVLILIDIGCFREKELTEGACACMEYIFQEVHISGKKMILRIAYDTEGKGAVREPLTIFQVKRHMEQVGGIVCRYAKDIHVLQGIFVGNWGEMHGSKFLEISDMTELINCLYRSVKGSCYLAVRTPGQWRAIIDSRKAAPGLQEVLGLFNDGVFGSPTDLGTYGEGRREEELVWQERLMESVPNGGEALEGAAFPDYRIMLEDMRRMHLSYLNCTWHPRRIKEWKTEQMKQDGCWRGKSLYEYIGQHLGYRFVVRHVKLISGMRLQVLIENCGFAGIYEDIDCILIIENNSGDVLRRRLDADARSWSSGKTVKLKISLKQEDFLKDGCVIFLQLERKRDGRIVRFANKGARESVRIGCFSDAAAESAAL